MAPQTSYSINIPAVAYPGQPVDIGNKDDLSGVNVLAAIPYGVLAVLDSGNTSDFGHIGAKVPAAAADITTLGLPLGVVLADQGRAQDPSVAVATYPINSALPLRREGRVWVLVEEAVNNGDQAFVRYATGSFTQKGAFRKSADTATAAALPNAYYRSNALAGGYAVLELSLK